MAFLKPIQNEDQATAAIQALKNQVNNMDKVYGSCADQRYEINAVTGEGSFVALSEFIA